MIVSFFLILIVAALLAVAAKKQKKLIQEFNGLPIAEQVLRQAEFKTSNIPDFAEKHKPLIMDYGKTYVFHDKSIATQTSKGWVVDKSTDAEDALLWLFEIDRLKDDTQDTVDEVLAGNKSAVQKGATVITFPDNSEIFFNRKIRYWVVSETKP